MKKYFKQRTEQKLLKTQKPFPYLGLEKSKTALILLRTVNSEFPQLCKVIEQMLHNNKVEVSFMCFEPIKLKKGEEAKANHYYQNQLDWIGMPKKSIVQDLTNKSFDVIIDLDEELESPNSFILLAANAGLRVGLNPDKGNYDLTISKGENDNSSLVKNLEHYLKTITKA